MVGYSLVTLLVKLATRGAQFSSFLVLSIATVIVCTSTLSITVLRGDARALVARDFASSSALWAYATGIALTVAVASLFRALSLGPASVVVPLYGMFIMGGAILGMVFLDEPPNLRKLLGIALATVSIFLIATGRCGARRTLAIWYSPELASTEYRGEKKSIRTRICDPNERQAGERATEVRIMIDLVPRLPCRIIREGEVAESE
jgi:transporter family protein